jgi:hypothetical protein
LIIISNFVNAEGFWAWHMGRNNKKVFVAISGLLIVATVLGYLIVSQTNLEKEKEREKEAALETMSAQQDVIEARIAAVKAADTLFQGYFYEEAIETLRDADPLIKVSEADIKYFDTAVIKAMEQVSADAIQSKIEVIEAAEASLVKYDGLVQHIFFHSLIVYPELAFDKSGGSAEGYNNWMVTVSEFKKMLPLLKDRGYILYSLSDYIEPDPDKPGQIKLKDIMVPKGKTPLVISIDDVSYYDYMKTDGFANRLVLGADDKIYTEVVSKDGNKTLTRDGDVMPILDDFVAANPDFSFRGAKGTIALTGFQGVLGYNFIQEKDPVLKAALMSEAKKTADMLKKNGWLFACHSYSHNQFFVDGTMTVEKMKHDLDQWILKIEPVVGKTNIYISPFGVRYKDNNPSFRYIVEKGFNIFCPVGNERRIDLRPDNISMGRVDIDGFSMTTRKDEITKYYFNVDVVLDPSRPSLF